MCISTLYCSHTTLAIFLEDQYKPMYSMLTHTYQHEHAHAQAHMFTPSAQLYTDTRGPYTTSYPSFCTLWLFVLWYCTDCSLARRSNCPQVYIALFHPALTGVVVVVHDGRAACEPLLCVLRYVIVAK